MKLPPQSSGRGILRTAVADYLGYEKIPETKGRVGECYARVMTAIANEVEQLQREGKWTPNQRQTVPDNTEELQMMFIRELDRLETAVRNGRLEQMLKAAMRKLCE